MKVGRLTCSFDRGLVRNQARDVGLNTQPTETPSGGPVCGLGTHYRSVEARENAKRWETEERRVRIEFARRFMASPIPGLFVLPERDAGDKLLRSLDVDPNVKIRCVPYDLDPGTDLPTAEVEEWASRIRNQLEAAPLGRGKEAGKQGLEVLDNLAACPVLSKETAQVIRDLVNQARLGQVDRIDFKRRISEINLGVVVGEQEIVVPPRKVNVEIPEEIPAETAPASETNSSLAETSV